MNKVQARQYMPSFSVRVPFFEGLEVDEVEFRSKISELNNLWSICGRQVDQKHHETDFDPSGPQIPKAYGFHELKVSGETFYYKTHNL